MGSEKLSNYKQARIKALVSAILIYICLGLVYAWSIFVTPLESEFGYGGTRTTNSFFIRKFYGNENYSQNFSIVNFGGIPASFLGASVGGIMQLQFSSYTFVMLYFAVMAVGALVMQHFIRKP